MLFCVSEARFVYNIFKEVDNMNLQKFTQKSLEALQDAQSLAIENQNPQVEQEHLLLALLEQENSLIKELIKKIGNEERIEIEVRKLVLNKPKVTGGGRQANNIYISQDLDVALANAEKVAKNMKDEYVSVEHIMLSLFDNFNVTTLFFISSSPIIITYFTLILLAYLNFFAIFWFSIFICTLRLFFLNSVATSAHIS